MADLRMSRNGFRPVAWGAFAALALCSITSSVPACSLCGSPIKQTTFGQDADRAAIILHGKVTDSRLSTDRDAPPGSGSHDFEIDEVLKGDPALVGGKKHIFPGYIPVLDAKNPPQFVMFCDVVKGKLTPQGGREVRSPQMLDYLKKSQAARAKKDRVSALLFYAGYLDHAEPVVAEDAFLEFAKSTDAEVGAVAERLDPRLFRKLIEDPKTPAGHLSLFAFLLAGSKDVKQADFLKNLLNRPDERTQEALDGILCGYIMLRPAEGWDRVAELLTDRKKPFKVRNNVLRTVRFYYNWKPKETRPQVVRTFKGMLEGDLADMAIEDLRRFGIFDHSELIYKQYARPGFDAPILRRSIIRYALVARRDAAASAAADRFLKSLPAKDQEIVREVAEGLDS